MCNICYLALLDTLCFVLFSCQYAHGLQENSLIRVIIGRRRLLKLPHRQRPKCSDYSTEANFALVQLNNIIYLFYAIHAFFNPCISQSVLFSIWVILNLSDSQSGLFSIQSFLNLGNLGSPPYAVFQHPENREI